MAALDYVHILERYYPLQSYDQAVDLHSKKSSARYMYICVQYVCIMDRLCSDCTYILV